MKKILVILLGCLISSSSFSQNNTASNSIKKIDSLKAVIHTAVDHNLPIDSTLVANPTLFIMSEIIQVGDMGLKDSETQIDTMQSIINDFKLAMTGFNNIIKAKDEIIETHQEEATTLISDKAELVKKNIQWESDYQALEKKARRKSIGMWTGTFGTVLITIPIIVLVTLSR